MCAGVGDREGATEEAGEEGVTAGERLSTAGPSSDMNI